MKRSAHYLLATLSLLLSKQVAAQDSAQPTPAVSEVARTLFRDGAQLAAEGRWLEARERFAHALQLRESPLLHYNLALASQNAGYLVEALDHFRSFLRLDVESATNPRRILAVRAIALIEPVIGHVVITVRADDADVLVALDGRQLASAMLNTPIPVDPGEHFVDARSPRLGTSQHTTSIAEGDSANVVLIWTPPAQQASGLSVDASVDSAVDASSPATVVAMPPRQPPAAPLTTIERIRHALEANARATDSAGARPWERTLALTAFVGTGHPAGILGVGIRWAARPWYELEANVGVGHPFGVGLTFLPAMFRAPLSAQFSLGGGFGLGTNFTELPSSSVPLIPGQTCRGAGGFTPMWLLFALSAEFRILSGAIAARFLAGVRYLANNAELVDGLQSRCIRARTTYEPRDLLYDPPTLDHSVFPVFPWFSFDIGYAR